MALHRIRKGLDLPLAGDPEQRIHDGPRVSHVAVLGDDTPGVRARLAVAEGDPVRRGQLLFEDRARPGARYTAPGAGRVTAIFRGPRRRLRSLVIRLTDSERAGRPVDGEFEPFPSWQHGPVASSAEAVRALLLESGLWSALRARPFGRVAEPAGVPHALFVTAIDTQPHAPDPQVVVAGAREDFELGLRLLACLCESPPIVSVAAGSQLAANLDAPVRVESFRGPHPAGNAGVHIHHLAPVSRERIAWHVSYQDVIAVGRLFATGRLPVERIVALAGPSVARPRLLRTRLGASIAELTQGELRVEDRPPRVISGSVLAGKRAEGPESGFLGRYHLQVSALPEGGQRRPLGWAAPGSHRFSLLPVFVSRLFREQRFEFTTDTHGSARPLMPIGSYERVLPMDILATYLLRALLVGDTEEAEKLGALELDEEDLTLCSFVCPGKTDFGPYLRASLERLEEDG